MTSREMHYDFKVKFNKLDAAKLRELLVPEIDRKLNEAQNAIIEMIAFPRGRKPYGFDIGQRTIDDIYTIVVEQNRVQAIVAYPIPGTRNYKVSLPGDYMFGVALRVNVVKGTCNKQLRATPTQHNDKIEEGSFSRASLEWEDIPYRITQDGAIVQTDGTFIINSGQYTYLRKPAFIHNAQDFEGGSYLSVDEQTTYTGEQNCELPETIHDSVVDLAVLFAMMDISSDISTKQAKTLISE